MLFGAYCGVAPGGFSQLTSFQNYLNGRKVDLCVEFLDWHVNWLGGGNDVLGNLDYLVNYWKNSNGAKAAQGYTNISLAVPLFTSQNADGTFPTYALGASGTYDSLWTSIAAKIAGYFPNAYIRLGWEFNGGWYPFGAGWGKNNTWSTVTDFINYWIRVVGILRAAMPNCKIVWNPTNFNLPYTQNGQSPYPDQMYPGDAYVDVMGLDWYDQDPVNASTAAARWQNEVGQTVWGLAKAISFAKAHGKKFAFPEWGAGTGPPLPFGDNPYWMQRTIDFIDAYQNDIEYVCYWNEDASGDTACRIDSNELPKQGAVFKNYFGQKPAAPARDTSTGAPVVVQHAAAAGLAVSLPGAGTPGNHLIAIVAADVNPGLTATSLVGWDTVVSPNAASHNIAIYRKKVLAGTDNSCAFAGSGTSFLGVTSLFEVSGLMGVSALQGARSAVSSAGETRAINKPSTVLALAVIEFSSTSSPTLNLAPSATTVNGDTVGGGGGSFYTTAIFDLNAAPEQLAISAAGASTPSMTHLLLAGRAALNDNTVAPTIVQSKYSAVTSGTSISATLTSAPTIGNTLVAVLAGDWSSADGIVFPEGWRMHLDGMDGQNLDAISVLSLPVTDPAQTTFTGTSAAGSFYAQAICLYEISGPVDLAVHRAIIAAASSALAIGAGAMPFPTLALPTNALALGCIEANGGTGFSITSPSSGVTVQGSFAGHGVYHPALFFSFPNTATAITAAGSGNLYACPIAAVIAITPK